MRVSAAAVLVSAAATQHQARAMLPSAVQPSLPYRGVWAMPTPGRAQVHLFGDASPQELESSGWRFIRHG